MRTLDVLLDVGGDVLSRYGTLTRRAWPADKNGESLQEAFTRSGSAGTFVGKDGLIYGAGANVPRTEWATDPASGLSRLYLLLENAGATNVVLWNRDMTNAAWTKTNMTAAKDQTGADGAASAASSLLATAGNATCLQAITLASSARFQSVYAKRLVGSGTIQMTMDNGSTWTTIALTTAYQRLNIPTQTLANPTVGFRIVTNGDKIAVDFVQNEAGGAQTAAIATTTVAVTRNVESFSLPWATGIGQQFVYARWVHQSVAPASGFPVLWEITSSSAEGAPRWLLYYGGTGVLHQVVQNGTNNDAALGAVTPSVGQVVETLSFINADLSGSAIIAMNAGAETTSGAITAQAAPSVWKTPTVLSIGAAQAGAVNPSTRMLLSRVMIGRGTPASSIAQFRSILVAAGLAQS